MKRIALWLTLLLCVGAMAQDKANPQPTGDQKRSDSAAPAKDSKDAATPDPSKVVPTLDGGLGACSAEFHITGGDGKPMYNVQVHTLIKYGAFGVKKLDLQLSTNYEGKAKFTGLPDVNKRPTFFDIKQGQKVAQRAFDPGANCHAVFEVTLQ